LVEYPWFGSDVDVQTGYLEGGIHHSRLGVTLGHDLDRLL
jgi:hypothetical protein